MTCPKCQVGLLKIWVSYRSTFTGELVSVRFRDEEDARRSLRPLGVTKFEVLPTKECSACHVKFSDVEELVSQRRKLQ